MSVVFRFSEVCKSYRSQLPSALGPHAPDTGNTPSGIMKDGWGLVEGMVEVLLYALACVNLAVVIVLAVDRFRSKGAIDDRLMELSDAAGAVAQELLARTESLMDLKQYMPDISLINQSPIQPLIDLFKSWRDRDIIPEENFTGRPRSEQGRWINGQTQSEENTTPSTEEDLTD